MTVLVVPISDAFSQTLRVQLGAQDCRIDIRQTRAGAVYLTLYIQDALIIAGAACRDRVRIVRSTYLGFVGDLFFLDTQGVADPVSPGMGTRFLLCYGEPGDF